MTINEYISDRFKGFNIKLSESNLSDICHLSDVDGSEEYDKGFYDAISVGIVKFIPELLLMPASSSISEGGFSKSTSWDIEGVKVFYSLMCKKYGLKDNLSNKPKVTFY